MMQTIKALFLDIGGVLGTNGWDRSARKRASEIFKLDYNDVDERHHLTFDTYEEGKLSLDEYLNRVIFCHPRPFTREEFKTFMYTRSEPYPQMIQLVKDLKSRYGLKIATVSNEGLELTEYRIQKFGLAEFVDVFISSCFVHYRKPDADIYHMALNVAQKEPQEVLYVDDRDLFVEVAQGLGLQGILHQGYESTKSLLASMGLSTSESSRL